MKSFFKSVVKSRAKDTSSEPSGQSGSASGKPVTSGFEGVDLENVNEAVEQIIRAQRSPQLRRHFFSIPASEYTSSRELRVWAGSFNTAAMMPRPDTNVHSWIHYAEHMWPERKEGDLGSWTGPDIVIAGFQEINALNASNMLMLQNGYAGTETVTAWDNVIGCVLNRSLPDELERAQAALRGLDSFGGVPLASAGSCEGTFGIDNARDKDEYVPDKDRYVHVCSRLLVGIYLTVWARKPVANYISGVQTSDVKTGAGGYLGNKGAVMVRMRVYDTPFCAVVAHLASGEAETDNLRRIADFTTIQRFGAFGTATDAAKGAGYEGFQDAKACPWTRSAALADQPNVVMLGDLNFRLEMEHTEVRVCLKARSYERLLARDQLMKEMERNQAFRAWKEGLISFPPTFKYVKGANQYIGDTLDTAGDDETFERESRRSAEAALDKVDDDAAADGAAEAVDKPEAARSGDADEASQELEAAEGADAQAEGGGARAKGKVEKTRTPAWTDRVLWKSDQKRLHLISYARAEINLSDHKPVMAEFLLNAEKIDRDRVNEAIEASRRACDVRANQALPRCTLSKRELFMGRVAYGESSSCTVVLRNEGEVAASFYFMPLMAGKLDEAAADAAAITPPWLRVHPAHGVVGVSSSVTITFVASVANSQVQDPMTCERLMQPGAKMEEILVLRIEDGSDHFIPVQGTYVPSFFGLTLSTLAALPRPLNPREGADAAAGNFESEPDLQSMVGDEYTAVSGLPFDPAFWSALPWELRSLLRHLSRDECLRTEGIFTDSYSLVQAASAVRSRAEERRLGADEGVQELGSIVAIRRALDAGEALPADVGPHDLAAALLSYFKALPRPFIPQQVSQICKLSVPPAATAAALLKDALKKTEWAALCCILHVMKLVLRPEQCELNKQNPRRLSKCLAEAWFPPVDLQDLDASTGDEDVDAERLQRMLEMASDITDRRIDLLQMFLQPGFGQH